jgi:hypothetical protein
VIVRARKTIVTLLAACATIACAPGPSQAAYAIRSQVIGNGATPSAGSTGSGRKVRGTAGQAIVGKSVGSNHEICHGYWCWGGTSLVSVDPPDEIESSLPKTLSFGAPRPNPTQDAARFAVDLPQAARIDLRIVDVQGRVVRVVESGSRTAGFHGLAWDGRDDAGARVLAGVYFARLTVEGVTIGTRRIVLRR